VLFQSWNDIKLPVMQKMMTRSGIELVNSSKMAKEKGG